VGRRRALEVPSEVPGRGLTRDGHLFQAALAFSAPIDRSAADTAPWGRAEGAAEFVKRARAAAGNRRAPALSHLPLVAAAPAPVRPGTPFAIGLSEFRSRPLESDLGAPGAHLLVFGDAGSGRSSLLSRVVTHLRAEGGGQPFVHLVDPTRGLAPLARALRPDSYAVSAAAAGRLAVELAASLILRLPGDELDTPGPRPAGPQHFLVVDDYDRLLQAGSGPFGPLVELVGWAADVGFHVILARRVAGSARTAFEPFMQRLREADPTALVLSGSAEEGPILAGVVARRLPPGRAVLVRPGSTPAVVQCYRPGPDHRPEGKPGQVDPGEDRLLRLVGAE